MDILNNICFVCLHDSYNLITVFHEERENDISTEVKYALPELMNSVSEDPVLYICSSCLTTLHSFYTFKKKCLENYNRLKQSSKILPTTNATEDQNLSEFQIRKSNCELLIKQESDILINIKKEFEDLNESKQQLYIELQTELNCNEDMIKQEQEVKQEENNLDEESTEDSANRELYQENGFENGDTVLTHVQKNISANNIALYKEEINLNIDSQKKFAVLTNVQNSALDNINENNIALYKEEVYCNTDSQKLNCPVLTNVQNSASDNINDNNIALYKEEVNFNTESQKLNCPVLTNVQNVALDSSENNKEVDNRQKLRCPICNKGFLKSLNLKKHIHFIHLIPKKNICSVCGKDFSQKSNLNTHMKVHLGRRNFNCSMCNQRFSTKWNLQRHVKCHLGVKDVECSVCNKKFIENYKLRNHMKIHERK